ncbi:MAG: ribosome biogenesis GTPase YlqF, partial [Clostridia bacterium]|nr:ribosome biogenesis GTPase YlqF [Clostridia bacterium]
ARAPVSSRNPSFTELFSRKPCLTLLTKCSLSDPKAVNRYVNLLKRDMDLLVPIDCKTGAGIKNVSPAIRTLMAEKLERDARKGIRKPVRAMIVGITNVGKSTFINTIAGSRRAKAEDRPGVTRQNQWFAVPSIGVEFLDTPGLLWHKFDDQDVARKLAMLGSINDDILDQTELVCALLAILRRKYPDLIRARYKAEWTEEDSDYDLFLEIGRRRGFLRSGGEIDEDRAAAVVLDEFRAGKIGPICLDD